MGPSSKNDAENRARILMVDDHPDTSAVMKRLLGSLGYDVRVAGSVKAALNAADSEAFDVLISDIGLPDGSGLDLMRELQTRSSGKLQGIALSGFGMEDDIRRSIEAGFHEHLVKPVNIQHLQELLRKLVG